MFNLKDRDSRYLGNLSIFEKSSIFENCVGNLAILKFKVLGSHLVWQLNLRVKTTQEGV